MKQTCVNESHHFYTRDEQEALIRAGFRCQVCNGGKPLLFYTRTTGSVDPADGLVLCEDCYDLAQIGKQSRMARESDDKLLMQIALLAFLFIVIALAVVGLACISPLVLFIMMLLAFFLAYLIVLVVNALRA